MDQILSSLERLKLPGMASCWQSLTETRKTSGLSLNDGLELLLQAEKDQRESSRYTRLLKKGHFRYQASIEEVNVGSARGLDNALVAKLATGEYIRNGNSVLITGSTGSGKSFFASALGNRACKQGYKVAYFNMHKFLLEMKMTRLDGTILKFFEKLAKIDLLIFDDFGLTRIEGQQQADFLEVIEDRHGKRSTIITSQLPIAKWFEVIAEETIADALLDRIVHTSYRFELESSSTLRKKL